MLPRRVVVTGLGLVSPLGLSAKENWKNLQSGKTGFAKLTTKEYQNLPCKIAGRVDQELLLKMATTEGGSALKQSDIRNMSRANLFAILAADEAVKDSGWSAALGDESVSTRAGVSIATGMSGIIEISEAAVELHADDKRGYKKMSAYFVPKILANLSSGLVSIRHKLRGPNLCATTACAAGSHSIADAYSLIRNGLADTMVCGATEACIHPVSISGFCRMRALATKFNENPELSSRPFDVDRDGFVMSEGSACLVLESLESAEKRGAAKIYGELLGCGMSADASHITNPDGLGALRCMQMAVANSSIKLDQINYINAHATSTPAGDVAEYSAIKKLFAQTGHHSSEVHISSFKGSLGHLLGAAGSAELALTLLALKEKIIPGSVNTRNLDPELGLQENLKIVAMNQVSLTCSSSRLIALKNSFGFGGTNCSLIVSTF